MGKFTAYGKRRFVTLGLPEEGWDRERAEAELRHVLADVERGIWQSHKPAAVEPPPEVPTFHEFASEWLAARAPELRPRTVEDYTWSLTHHLLPFFAHLRLTEVTAEEVDRYKAGKLNEGKLGPSQINKTLKRLSQVLDTAVDYGYLTQNPAASRGGRRRVKEPDPRRSWVEPEQLMALLDAAPPGHRPVLATLAGAGLRVGEACALNWGDVNLATGTITIQQAKTSAGTGRKVDLPRALADELWNFNFTSTRTGPDDPVFVSRARNGRQARQTKDNVGRRLKGAIKGANVVLAEQGIEPISERVTPHSLRRTFASLRYACGDDPIYVAEQGGWKDPAFPMKVYARAVRRRERLSGSYLEAYDAALRWAEHGAAETAKPARQKAEKGRIDVAGPKLPPSSAEAEEQETAL